MDYGKIKEFLVAQRSRAPRPMSAFTKSMLDALRAVEELEGVNVSEASKALLTNLLVPHLVTMVECYFRDSLDAIFRLCTHTAYLSALNKLVKQKYTVQEIIGLEAEGLHFLQVIPRELSFQNMDQITSAFDNFIAGGLVAEMKKNQFRFKDHPDHVIEVNQETLGRLSTLFSLRHQIVHNPNDESLHKIIPDIGSFVMNVWDFVFCANQIIEEFIGRNLKDSVRLVRESERPN